MKKFILISLLVILFLLIISVTLFITIQPPRVTTTEHGPANQPATKNSSKTKPERGAIFDRNHNRLAGNYPIYAVYAKPREIDNPEQIAAQLAKILNQDRQQLLTGLKAVRGYLWLAQDVAGQTVDQIKNLDAKGIHFKESMKRYYPHKTSAAHLIGFSKENQGLDGLESRFDSLLRGEPQNTASLPMVDFGVAEQLGSNGAHLVTTLDLSVQKRIEQKLAQLIDITDAESGSAVVINPEDGAIIAMANLPSYDPNTFWNFDQDSRRNRAVTDTILNGPLSPQIYTANQDHSGEIKTMRLPSGRELTVVSPILRKQVISFKKTKKGSERLTFFRDLMEMSNCSLLTFAELPGQKSIKALPATSDDSPSATAVQLLVALASLLKKGELVTPHLLSSVRDRASHRSFARKPNSEQRFILSPEESASLTKQFKEISVPGPRGSRFIETALSSHLIRKNIQDTEEEYDREPFGPERNQVVTIGSAPGILMLISLDKALLPASVASGRQESVVLTHSRRLLPQLLNIINRKDRTVTEEFWQTSWNSPQEHVPETAERNRASSTTTEEDFYIMPDVTGKSLRGGLQILQDLHLLITITGSGRIINQQPAAGAAVREGENCVLELRSDN
jgi:cell division protein FtsI (penicillin-binding protein 3)